MHHVITFVGNSREPRLDPQEIEDLARFAYAVHDHQASTPAQPIFWHRIDSDLTHYWS
jgi:hypothetical protein